MFATESENQSRRSFAKFRLWHLFVLVGVVATFVWIQTERGMESAEVKILKFKTWSDSDSSKLHGPSTQREEVISLEFQYVQLGAVPDQTVLVFFNDPTIIRTGKIKVGDQLKFRYRARPSFWLKRVHPNFAALDRMGFDRSNVQEVITATNFLDSTVR